MPAGRYLCEVGGTFIVVAPTPESAAPTPRTDDGLPPPSQYRSSVNMTTMTGASAAAAAAAAAGGGDDASVASSLATPRDKWDDLHADVLRREFPYASCQQNVTNTTKVRPYACPRQASIRRPCTH